MLAAQIFPTRKANSLMSTELQLIINISENQKLPCLIFKVNENSFQNEL